MAKNKSTKVETVTESEPTEVLPVAAVAGAEPDGAVATDAGGAAPDATAANEAAADGAVEGAAAAGEEPSDEMVKDLLEKNEAAIFALPGFAPPKSKAEALALLARAGVTYSEEAKEPAPSIDAAAASPAVQDAARAGLATAEESTTPPVLEKSKAGQLTWSDPSNGKAAFVVEVSRDRRTWSVEAELPAGFTRYTPVNCAGTAFYRVRAVFGDSIESLTASNEVVIHFN